MERAFVLLDDVKKKVNRELKIFLDKEIRASKNMPAAVRQSLADVKEFTLRGGKRLRPAMVYYVYQALGGKNLKAVIRASMSIELVQSMFLIHDDIMDRADIRRQKPALHVKVAKRAKKGNRVEREHEGLSVAINAGDLAEFLAHKALSQSGFPPDRIIQAYQALVDLEAKTSYGQAVDILSAGKILSEKEVLNLYFLKSGNYTVIGPTRMGAALAGASAAKIKALDKFTAPIGLTFQIQDDILGLFGTVKDTGKPVTSDLREGKMTILIAKAYEMGSAAQRQEIKKLWGNPRASMREVRQMQRVVRETGAWDYIQKLAHRLGLRSVKALSKLRLQNPGKEFLEGVAEYIIRRTN